MILAEDRLRKAAEGIQRIFVVFSSCSARVQTPCSSSAERHDADGGIGGVEEAEERSTRSFMMLSLQRKLPSKNHHSAYAGQHDAGGGSGGGAEQQAFNAQRSISRSHLTVANQCLSPQIGMTLTEDLEEERKQKAFQRATRTFFMYT